MKKKNPENETLKENPSLLRCLYFYFCMCTHIYSLGQILQNAENQTNEIDISSSTPSSAESQESGKNDDFKPFFHIR